MFVIAFCTLVGCGSNEFNAPIAKSMKCKKKQTNHFQKEFSKRYDQHRQVPCFDTKYQVKKGDTLFYIAWITGTNYHFLAKKNNIPKPYNIYVGQTIYLYKKKTTQLITNNKLPLPKTTLITSKIQKNTGFATNSGITPTLKNVDSINSDQNYECINRKDAKKISLPSNENIFSASPSREVSIKSRSIFDKEKNIKMHSSNLPTFNWSWPAYGKIIGSFSSLEGGNKGIDISGKKGQPILAAASGKVVYVGNALRGYGNLIIIKHKNDYLSAYAHNDRILVREQEEVKNGQKIATMGDTGTNIIKLHFEIRHKGKSINPLCFFQKKNK
ncbi:murein hydrolase activator NlpD [Sodalis sp. CWE]|uniref:murein hydrolase activator NlpD n=1 Tax=Sodalis sp. CWE TaxID=2803816 RepID=UPI001C7D04EC|nr:murein hydrolase activator NlpD [Sodalis sp. CWE]MBX4180985.1 murein hydrolase activator NlpD [Sodalis sp. CWE]